MARWLAAQLLSAKITDSPRFTKGGAIKKRMAETHQQRAAYYAPDSYRLGLAAAGAANPGGTRGVPLRTPWHRPSRAPWTPSTLDPLEGKCRRKCARTRARTFDSTAIPTAGSLGYRPQAAAAIASRLGAAAVRFIARSSADAQLRLSPEHAALMVPSARARRSVAPITHTSHCESFAMSGAGDNAIGPQVTSILGWGCYLCLSRYRRSLGPSSVTVYVHSKRTQQTSPPQSLLKTIVPPAQGDRPDRRGGGAAVGAL